MHYLYGTINLVLYYQGGDLTFKGYSDADWGGGLAEYRLTLGCVFTFGGEVTS